MATLKRAAATLKRAKAKLGFGSSKSRPASKSLPASKSRPASKPRLAGKSQLVDRKTRAEADREEETESENEWVSESEWESEQSEYQPSTEDSTSASDESLRRPRPSARKRKRKSPKVGFSDPFSIPPNKMTVEVFKAINPLIVEEDYIPDHCRFGGDLRMDPGAIDVFLSVSLGHFIKADESFKQAKGEMERRIKDAALLTDIKQFTKISDQGTGGRKRRKISEEDLKINAPQAEPQYKSSNESLNNDHEKQSKGRGKSDFRMFVKDYRGGWRKQMQRTVDNSEPWRLAVTVEAKDEEKVEALHQAFASSSQEIVTNVKEGHVDPVYALAMARGKWTYAMLEIDGLIELRNGAITLSSYKDYKKTAKLRLGRLLKKKIDDKSPLLYSLEDLEERFAERLALYRSQYKDNPKATYPNGFYVVGSLHVESMWYTLPNPREMWGLASHGSKLFYQGLLRSIVGEKVLDWKTKDALNACETRGTLNAESMRLGGVSEHIRLLPMYQYYNSLPDAGKLEFERMLKGVNDYNSFVNKV